MNNPESVQFTVEDYMNVDHKSLSELIVLKNQELARSEAENDSLEQQIEQLQAEIKYLKEHKSHKSC